MSPKLPLNKKAEAAMRPWTISIGALAFGSPIAPGAQAANLFFSEPKKPAFTASFAARYRYGMAMSARIYTRATRSIRG